MVPIIFLRDGECADVELVARTHAGAEVERRSGPFCPGDEWIIDGKSETPSAEPTPTPVPT